MLFCKNFPFDSLIFLMFTYNTEIPPGSLTRTLAQYTGLTAASAIQLLNNFWLKMLFLSPFSRKNAAEIEIRNY